MTMFLVISCLYTLLAFNYNAINCGPLSHRFREDEAITNDNQLFPEIDNQIANYGSNVDFMVRKARKENSEQDRYYLEFNSQPPVELTLQENSKYILECEVSGAPKPSIHWMKNGNLIYQGEQLSKHNSQYGKLGLSRVKSRLYLDCLTQSDNDVTYTCIASTPLQQLVSNTKLTIRRQAPISERLQHRLPSNGNNKEVEYYGNQNSIDLLGKSADDSNLYSLESTLTGCLSKKSFGSPARIYFWTHTILENIGADGIINCRAHGFPKPMISWYDSDDKKIVPDLRKYEILNTGDLLIRNITFNDMGKYKCVAKNQHGTDTIDKVFFYPTAPNKPEDSKSDQ